jgi:acyl transferase domain-containing protein
VNGRTHTVISGQGEAVEALARDFAAQGMEATMLVVSHAFHSVLQEPILDAFERAASQITYRAPQMRVVSNLTGRIFTQQEIPDARYWRRHLRETVQFASGMEAVEQLGCDTFLEIGPHPTLLGMARRCIQKADALWLPSIRRGRDAWPQLAESLATLYVRGANVDWTGFERDYPHRKVSLPTYPFQRERFWPEAPADVSQARQRQAANDALALRRAPQRATPVDWFYEMEWRSGRTAFRFWYRRGLTGAADLVDLRRRRWRWRSARASTAQRRRCMCHRSSKQDILLLVGDRIRHPAR